MTRTRWMTLALTLLLAGCGSEGTEQPYGQDTDAFVLNAVKVHGPNHVLLIGDSLTAYNPLTELCGLPVIRAGYIGAKWHTVAERPIWAQIHSRFVIVQLGTNNALKGPSLTKEDMEPFLERIQANHLIVVVIPPFFDPAYLNPVSEERTQEIQGNQARLTYQILDERPVMQNPDLFADGIHWNAAGYQVHNANLAEAVCAEQEAL